MDRVSAMRVFVDVGQTCNFTASAQRLDMSRAMVTRYVSEMETWLGVRLFQRTTRRVVLTDAGEQAMRRCLQILQLVDDTEEEVAPPDGELRGQIRLTSSVSFGHAQLAGAITRFQQQHPQLRIDLDVGDRLVNLIESRIDLAIRIGNDPDPGLIARPLAVCESVLVAAPAYLKKQGKPKHPADLAGHRCLGHANVGRSTWVFQRGEVTETVNVWTAFTANEATALLQAAIHGGGIALQPTYLANQAIHAGHVVKLLADWRPSPLAVTALYPSRRHLSPAVRQLLDYLVDQFTDAPW